MTGTAQVTAGLGIVAAVAIPGTLVGMAALRAIRRDPAGYTRRMIGGSMISVGLVAVPCVLIAPLCLYLGVTGAVVGWPAFASYLAFAAVFGLLGLVCVSTARDMGRCRKAVK